MLRQFPRLTFFHEAVLKSRAPAPILIRGGGRARWELGPEEGLTLSRAACRPWLTWACTSSGLPPGWPTRPSRPAEGLRLRRRADADMAPSPRVEPE